MRRGAGESRAGAGPGRPPRPHTCAAGTNGDAHLSPPAPNWGPACRTRDTFRKQPGGTRESAAAAVGGRNETFQVAAEPRSPARPGVHRGAHFSGQE